MRSFGIKSNVLLLLVVVVSLSLAQGEEQAPVIDVHSYEVEIELTPDRNFVQGKSRAQLTVLEDSTSLSFDFNQRLTLLSVEDEEGFRYSLSSNQFSRGRVDIEGQGLFRQGDELNLIFTFEGSLEREQFAFLNEPFREKAVIGSHGAILLSEGHWFPSHRLPLDPAISTFKIKVPLGFTAVGPGELESVESVFESSGVSEVFTWRSDVEVTHFPVVVDRFLRQVFEDGSIPLTFYMSEDYDQDLTPIAEEARRILDFYRREYGSSPIESLVLVEVGNIELGSTGSRELVLLEQNFLEAEELPVMELARRLAQQWWGYSVKMQRPMDGWLKDGFATYAALRYFEETDSERFQIELSRQSVQALKYQDTAPVASGLNLEEGSARYDSIVGSKGAWVLYMLGQLMGRESLNTALVEWYRMYEGKMTSTPEFVRFVQERSQDDYDWFFVQWIDSVGVPKFEVDYTIYRVTAGGYRITGEIKQNLDLFRMPIDVLIETKDSPEEQRIVANGRSTSFEFETDGMPQRVEIDPHGKILMDSDRMRVAVHIAIGDEYRQRGEFVSAIEEYEKAIDLNPRSSLAHFRLGEVFFEQHSYSNAANSMREVLNGDLQPDWVETWAYIYMGKVYDILGQRQRAISEYQKAINSKVDYNGAQAEAEKYKEDPYTRPSSVIGG